jgi:cytochrome c-type biogenesis protein CcmH
MNALFPLWAGSTTLLLLVLGVLLRPLLRAESVATTSPGSPRQVGRAWRLGAAALVSLALPIAALTVYLKVGNPRAAAEIVTGVGTVEPHPTTGVDVEAMVEGLAAKLREQPDDLQGWQMLARSREVQERYDDAAEAYRRAIALAGAPDLSPLRAKLQADLADALGSAQGGDLSGPAQAAIDAALALDPDQPKALALGGAAAVRRGDQVTARRHWTRLLGLLEPGSEMAQRVTDDLARLAGGPSMTVVPPTRVAEPAGPARAASATPGRP